MMPYRRHYRLALVASVAALGTLGCAEKAGRERPGPVPEEASSAPGETSGSLTSEAGSELFFEIVGDGPETVVVPLGFFLGEAFASRSELLEGRRWVFYDPRNRGRSEAVGESDSVGLQGDVADLERLRRHLGIERMDLVGFSIYAKMVVLYGLEHPERVGRIVQLGPPARLFGTRYPPHLQASDRVEAMGREAMMEVQRLQTEGYHEREPRAYCEREWEVTRRALVADPALADRIPSPCEHEREWPLHLYRHFERALAAERVDPGAEALDAFEVPVLTLHGTRDRNAPYGAGREWAVELGNARLLTLEGAAHCSWVERPEVVFTAIDTFLAGDWPSAAEEIERLDPRVEPGAEV